MPITGRLEQELEERRRVGGGGWLVGSTCWAAKTLSDWLMWVGLQPAAGAGARGEAAGGADGRHLPPLTEGAHHAGRGAAGHLQGQAREGEQDVCALFSSCHWPFEKLLPTLFWFKPCSFYANLASHLFTNSLPLLDGRWSLTLATFFGYFCVVFTI